MNSKIKNRIDILLNFIKKYNERLILNTSLCIERENTKLLKFFLLKTPKNVQISLNTRGYSNNQSINIC